MPTRLCLFTCLFAPLVALRIITQTEAPRRPRKTHKRPSTPIPDPPPGGGGENNSAGQRKGQTHVLQIGDADSFKTYDIWVQSVRMFAGYENWPYTASVSPSGQDRLWYHHQKPYVINKTLHELPEGDVLFFIDLDVAVDGAALQAKAALLFAHGESKAKAKQDILLQAMSGSFPDHVLFRENMTCDFMGQDGPNTLNSGVLVFRASAAGRKLSSLYAERITNDIPMDQLALQSAVLSLAIPTYKRECENERKAGQINAWRANDCYDRKMHKHGYPRNNRSFKTYCILDSSRHLSMHDGDNHYTKGDILYHGKNESRAQSLRNSWNQ